VPGDIRTLKSAGCHRLIRDGAVLVEKVEDVLEELQHLFPRNQVVQAARTPPVPELSARQRTLPWSNSMAIRTTSIS